MTRWAFVTLVAVLAVGAVGVFVARKLGRSNSRASALTSVVSQWLAAWVLWTFAAGLLLRSGVLVTYEQTIFTIVAFAGAWLHYRTLVTGARERARAIFVGVQLAWLVVLLVRNGLF